MSQDSILVLDQYPQTLAIVRSLGRRGYHMVLGRCESMVPTYLEHSRYCGEVWIHPEYSDAQDFEHALRRFLAERPDVQTIFPAGEPATAALATFSGLENDGYSLVMVGKDLFEVCRDKHKANTLARDAGLTPALAAARGFVYSQPVCNPAIARSKGLGRIQTPSTCLSGDPHAAHAA